MTEYTSSFGRGLRSRLFGFLVMVGAALLLVPIALASASEPLVPPAFRLQASNGYTLSVIAFENRRTGRGGVDLIMRSRHAAVFYGAPAAVGPTSIEADLGAIGRIDVNFVSSGQSHSERSDCGGKPVLVDSGRYEGGIDLEGEEGYSEAHASSARGEVKTVLNLLCSGGPRSEGVGGHSPGARLTVAHRGARRFEFTAMKNGPTRPVRFAASVSERRGRLSIFRGTGVTAAPGSFDFDVPSGTAQVSPPQPFSGEASYFRTAGKRATWQGDLSVDLPGRANFQLTGRGTRVGLIRAVLNPGHPFRLP